MTSHCCCLEGHEALRLSGRSAGKLAALTVECYPMGPGSFKMVPESLLQVTGLHCDCNSLRVFQSVSVSGSSSGAHSGTVGHVLYDHLKIVVGEVVRVLCEVGGPQKDVRCPH